MAKVRTIVASTLMPISAAVSRSSETARMARPVRVRLMRYQSPIISAMALKITMSWVARNGMPATSKVPSRIATLGYERTPLPYSPRKAYCRNSEAPMAVMSGTSRGALRSLR